MNEGSRLGEAASSLRPTKRAGVRVRTSEYSNWFVCDHRGDRARTLPVGESRAFRPGTPLSVASEYLRRCTIWSSDTRADAPSCRWSRNVSRCHTADAVSIATPCRMSCSLTSTRSSPNAFAASTQERAAGDDRRRAVGVQTGHGASLRVVHRGEAVADRFARGEAHDVAVNERPSR